MPTRIGLALVIIAALSSCKIFEFDGDPSFTTRLGIEHVKDNRAGCRCAQSVYLRNYSQQERRGTVRITSIPPIGASQTRVVEETVAGGDRVYLGCSRNVPRTAPVGSLNCTQENRYQITNQEQASLDFQLRFAMQNAAGLSEVSPTLIQLSDALSPVLPNCKFECTDPSGGSGMCTSLPGEVSDIGSDLMWLAAAIDDANGRSGAVKKGEIMAEFGVERDPCERTDTVVIGSEVTNDGDACRLEATLETPFGATNASVHMPNVVRGQFSIEQQDYVVRFEAATERLSLSFDDPLVQRNLGGDIYEIRVGPEGVIATSPSGCLHLDPG